MSSTRLLHSCSLSQSALLFLTAAFEPLGVYRLMIQEAFGGQRQIAATLTAATPLLLTGLAAAIAFRAGIFNVGAEGCFYLGGIVAAVIGFAAPTWPSFLLILVPRHRGSDRLARSA
jgi:general nucleoside transport system permease protein